MNPPTEDVYNEIVGRFKVSLDQAVAEFFARLKRAAPGSGRLASRMLLHKADETPTAVRYQITAPQGLYFTVTGTRPHLIRPRRAKVLRWTDAEGTHFATFVRHPGTAPQRWVEDAIGKFRFPEFIRLSYIGARGINWTINPEQK